MSDDSRNSRVRGKVQYIAPNCAFVWPASWFGTPVNNWFPVHAEKTCLKRGNKLYCLIRPQEIPTKPVVSSAPTPTIVRPGSLPLHLSNDALHPTLPSPTSVITQAPPSNRQLR